MTVYPKWKYHSASEPIAVGSKEAETALGPGWVDSPEELIGFEGEMAQVESVEVKE